jgi:hypothetical protein
MDKQARIRDKGLVKNIEVTGRSQTLPWCLREGGREGGVKTPENKNALATLMQVASCLYLLTRGFSFNFSAWKLQ